MFALRRELVLARPVFLFGTAIRLPFYTASGLKAPLVSCPTHRTPVSMPVLPYTRQPAFSGCESVFYQKPDPKGLKPVYLPEKISGAVS
jgi:hypothetical protein